MCIRDRDIIGSLVPIDITSDNEKNKKYVSFVVGIIDGLASLFAGLGQIFVGYISETYGWNYVFYSFIINLLLSAFLILIIQLRYKNKKMNVNNLRE